MCCGFFLSWASSSVMHDEIVPERAISINCPWSNFRQVKSKYLRIELPCKYIQLGVWLSELCLLCVLICWHYWILHLKGGRACGGVERSGVKWLTPPPKTGCSEMRSKFMVEKGAVVLCLWYFDKSMSQKIIKENLRMFFSKRAIVSFTTRIT